MFALNFPLEKFDAHVLKWATQEFAREVDSGFPRVLQFDGISSRDWLSALILQPKECLAVLAEVLPRGVLSDAPDRIAIRNQLPAAVRVAVERFREDYDRIYRQRFDEHVIQRSRRRAPEVKDQFATASREGNQILQHFAVQLEGDLKKAARGEWALVFHWNSLRITLSLTLAPHMELDYDIGIFDTSANRSLRFHDNYLALLGLGRGTWYIGPSDQFRQQLMKATAFGYWHVQQYQQLIISL